MLTCCWCCRRRRCCWPSGPVGRTRSRPPTDRIRRVHQASAPPPSPQTTPRATPWRKPHACMRTRARTHAMLHTHLRSSGAQGGDQLHLQGDPALHKWLSRSLALQRLVPLHDSALAAETRVIALSSCCCCRSCWRREGHRRAVAATDRGAHPRAIETVFAGVRRLFFVLGRPLNQGAQLVRKFHVDGPRHATRSLDCVAAVLVFCQAVGWTAKAASLLTLS